jgi:hypothetical protein
MSTAVVIPINQGELEARALSVPEQAAALEVHDQPTYERAATFLCDVVAAMRKEVESTFDSSIRQAHQLHKELCAQRNRHLDPILKAEALIKQRIGAYELDCRRRQEEAERQAREAAELAAAQATEYAIEEAEAQGATVEEVTAIIEQPVVQTRPFVAPTFQRVKGVTTRGTFKAEIRDLRTFVRAVAEGKVPLNCLMVNETALNALARAHGAELERHVPGVRAVQVSSVATGRR